MVTDSFLSLACAGLIALAFGLTLSFAGYRLFILLLPIWGFFFGLALGAQTMQALFPGNFPFLGSVTSWVVGFVVGAIFAVLAYLFYMFAVAIIAGSLGYVITIAILTGIGLNLGFIVWLIGLVVAVVAIIVTFMFNLQKWAIIAATSILGAGAVVGVIEVMFNPVSAAIGNPVQIALKTSWLLVILFLVVAIMGFISQVQTTRKFELVEYNHWEDEVTV